MEIQDNQEELNLFEDLSAKEEKTECNNEQNKSTTSENAEDSPVSSSTTQITNNNNELPFEDELFGELFKKIQMFVNQSKQEKFTKDTFILERDIFVNLFSLIEQHQTTFTDDQMSLLIKGFRLFIHSIDPIKPNQIFATYLSYAKKEIFYLYFNLINLRMIQNYLKHTDIFHELTRICRYGVSRILTVMRHCCICTDLAPDDEQRPENTLELLSLLLDNVRTDLESANLTVNPSPNDPSITRFLILIFLWDYSDKTILVGDLLEAGCSQILIDGLTSICNTENATYDIGLQIISTLHNISRHDDGIKQLNDLNATALIKIFQSKNQDDVVNTTCCMILALLLTPEQIKSEDKCIDDILDKLLGMLYLASVSSTDRFDGYHLSEMLVVFVKLFNDDRILDYIMKHSKVDLHASSTTEFFINLLINYSSKTKQDGPMAEITYLALVNILWSLSFQENYKQQLKNSNPQFQSLIQDFTKRTDEHIPRNQYVPQYIESLQKAATGLLFNMNQITDLVIEQDESTTTEFDEDEKAMIMISYSHADIEFCKQLYREMLQRGYHMWVDFEDLKSGDLWEQIAAGMKRADIILCLVSETYCKSKSCRWEATYALDKLQRTKSIIPVFLQKYELPEWLDIRTAILRYVRFRDSKQLERDKLFELINMIDRTVLSIKTATDHDFCSSLTLTHDMLMKPSPTELNRFILQSNNTLWTKLTVTQVEQQDIPTNDISIASVNPTQYAQKPVEEWDENDIYNWFEDNEILPELRTLCHFKDGCELIIYARLFLDTEKLQYQLYSEEFLRHDGVTSGQKPLLLHQFTKFSNALRKLKNFKK